MVFNQAKFEAPAAQHEQDQEVLQAEGVNDWRYLAECREEDPDLFFPVGESASAKQQIEDAKAVCGRCIVQETCLLWALESGQDSGVWGGKSEDERRALKRGGDQPA